ncbi:unnamed protein product [Candida verbasci]|uniref:Uncharacterized protein n=1 Tax=Candida verbasci TaxID=1227364 RepID=A0A9W4XF52_9ASCO|nr:unnamed protein product [Candida verbasci]
MDNTTNNEQQDIIDIIFKDYNISDHQVDTNVYPESILHQTAKGNKLYTQFQSYNRQFINDDSSSNIVRWKNSIIEQASNIILNNWLNQNNDDKSISTISLNNALFTWSSTDEYIARRKKQLQKLKGIKEEIEEHHEEVDKSKNELIEKLNLKFSKEPINHRLNRAIESESNKFISDRIKVIRQYHTQKMLEEIEERKKNDYETYLKKLKLREEELEKQDANLKTNSGNFFGNLFGFNTAKEEESRNSFESETTLDSSTHNKRKTGFPLFGATLFSSKKPQIDKPETLFETDHHQSEQSFNLDIDQLEQLEKHEDDDEEDEKDDDFTDFTSTKPENESPKKEEVKLNRNFFSIDKAKPNNELIDLFDNDEPVFKDNNNNNNTNDDVNLLDL